jgi:uncharacterized membrane protein
MSIAAWMMPRMASRSDTLPIIVVLRSHRAGDDQDVHRCFQVTSAADWLTTVTSIV